MFMTDKFASEKKGWSVYVEKGKDRDIFNQNVGIFDLCRLVIAMALIDGR